MFTQKKMKIANIPNPLHYTVTVMSQASGGQNNI
jgi:hypothetical protein